MLKRRVTGEASADEIFAGHVPSLRGGLDPEDIH